MPLEEKIIDGHLMYRSRSDVSWQYCTLGRATEVIREHQQQIKELKEALTTSMANLT